LDFKKGIGKEIFLGGKIKLHQCQERLQNHDEIVVNEFVFSYFGRMHISSAAG